jgi:hypothetical protein
MQSDSLHTTGLQNEISVHTALTNCRRPWSRPDVQGLLQFIGLGPPAHQYEPLPHAAAQVCGLNGREVGKSR